MFFEAPKNSWQPRVPLVPVMAAYGVKFIAEMALAEQCGELAIRGQQALLLAAGEEKVWGVLRICAPRQDERIVVAAGLAPRRSEDRFVVP